LSKAIFIHKSDSIYDDVPWERYDFPQTYLKRVSETVGDWIIYYEPRSANKNKGSLAYFSCAKIHNIVPNPTETGRYFALIEPGTYQSFDRLVPRECRGVVIEKSLRSATGGLVQGGYSQSAVRILEDAEFDTILGIGFSTNPLELGLRQSPETVDGFNDPPAIFERPFVEILASRKFRENSFARQVKSAYGGRCAVSGLEIRNGGGRPEVEAAHIMSVADNGPDTVRNGLALSRSVHWMFDRGLISVDEDHTILVADNGVPDSARRLFLPNDKLFLPKLPMQLPHPKFLQHHRENVFHG